MHPHPEADYSSRIATAGIPVAFSPDSERLACCVYIKGRAPFIQILSVDKGSHPVDVVVGTPMKIMEMIRGRGWDRKEGGADDEAVDPKSLRRGRDKMTGYGRWRSKPELGLENIEWVVVDEADVLLGMSPASIRHPR